MNLIKLSYIDLKTQNVVNKYVMLLTDPLS